MGDLIGDPQAAREVLPVLGVVFGLLCAGGALKYARQGTSARLLWISIGFSTLGAAFSAAATFASVYYKIGIGFTASMIGGHAMILCVYISAWLRYIKMSGTGFWSKVAANGITAAHGFALLGSLVISVIHYGNMVF